MNALSDLSFRIFTKNWFPFSKIRRYCIFEPATQCQIINVKLLYFINKFKGHKIFKSRSCSINKKRQLRLNFINE